MIQSHDDDIVGVGEAGAIENASRTRAARKSTAVQPHHYRPLASVLQPGSENIQHETVLALLSGRSRSCCPGIVAALRRVGTEGERIPRAGPRGRLDGRHEAVLTTRRRAIRNTLEHPDAIDHGATDFSVRRVGDCSFQILRLCKRRPWREACTRQKKGRVLRKSAPADHVWHIAAPWRIRQIIDAKKGDGTDFGNRASVAARCYKTHSPVGQRLRPAAYTS